MIPLLPTLIEHLQGDGNELIIEHEQQATTINLCLDILTSLARDKRVCDATIEELWEDFFFWLRKFCMKRK